MHAIGPQENLVFSDEENLVAFLGKNENRKADDTLQYKPVKSDLIGRSFALCGTWMKIIQGVIERITRSCKTLFMKRGKEHFGYTSTRPLY